MINNNIEIDEYVNNIIQIKGLKNTGSSRKHYKQKIERFRYLNEKYEDKLRLLYFSFSKLSRLSKVKWEEWLFYLNIQFNVVHKSMDLQI